MNIQNSPYSGSIGASFILLSLLILAACVGLKASDDSMSFSRAAYQAPATEKPQTSLRKLEIIRGYYMLTIPYVNEGKASIAVCGFLDINGNGILAEENEICLVRGLTTTAEKERTVVLKWPAPAKALNQGMSAKIVFIPNDADADSALALIRPSRPSL